MADSDTREEAESVAVDRYFLSFASNDEETAQALSDGLRRQRLDVFCASRPGEIRAGEKWVPRLERELRRCSTFLLLAGARYDRWVRAEIEAALILHADFPERLRIVVLLPDGAQQDRLPLLVRRFQAIRLEGAGDSWDEALFAPLAQEVRPAGEPIAVTPAAARLANPYPGLEPYREDRAELFFGRESELADLRRRLDVRQPVFRRWLQLIGPSGAGKSSLALAGLVPALRRSPVFPDRPDGPHWSVGVLRPGHEPLLSLAQALVEAGDRPDTPLEFAQVRDRLRSSPGGLRELLGELAHQGRYVALVIDQLEEAFTLAPSPQEQPAPDTDRAHLDQLLATPLRAMDLPFRLVTTLRSDFLDPLAETLPELKKAFNDHAATYLLGPMEPAALRDAIVRPAEAAGVRFDPALAERLAADASAEDGSLPLLGHVLRSLWDERTDEGPSLDAYEAMGRLAGALGRHADELVESLSEPGDPERARRMLLRLIWIGHGERDTRRPAPRSEVLAAGGGGEAATRVLLRLSGGRLPLDDATRPARIRLMVAGEERVDLIHEALLSSWERLRTWIDEDRETLRLHEDLEAAARSWHEAGRPEDDSLPGGVVLGLRRGESLPEPQRERYHALTSNTGRAYLGAAEHRASTQARQRTRRRRWTIGSLLAVLLIVSGLAAFAYDRAERAGAQEQLAQQRLEDAVGVAKHLVFTVDRRLMTVAGASGARQELLESGRELLRKLGVEAAASDPDAKAAPRDSDAERVLMVNHGQSGDLAMERGELGVARGRYQAMMEIAKRRVAEAPDDPMRQDDLAVSHEKLGDLALQRRELDEARTHFQAALAIAKELAAADPDNAGWQYRLALSRHRAGALATLRGEPAEAQRQFEAALAIAEKLAAAEPENAEWQRALSVSHAKLGALMMVIGKLAEARMQFEAALAIATKLAARELENADLQRALSMNHRQLGGLAAVRGELGEARMQFEAALAIVKKLAAREPENTRWLRDLAACHNQLGDLAVKRGELAEARMQFEAHLAIAKKLAAAEPENAGWQHDLELSYSALGDLAVERGEQAEAWKLFEAAHTIARKLAAAEPENALWQGELAIRYEKLGDLAVGRGELAEAQRLFEAAHTVAEKLAAAKPDSAGWQRGLRGIVSKLGDVAARRGDLAEARRLFETHLALAKKLAAAEPDYADWQHDLAVSYSKLGNLAVERGDLAEARRRFEAALTIAKKLAATEPENAGWQRGLAACHSHLGDLAVERGDLAEARRQLEAALAIAKRLAAAEPEKAEWQRDLAVSHQQIALVESREERHVAAREAQMESLALITRLAEKDPANASWQLDRAIVLWTTVAVLQAADATPEECEPHLRAGLAICARLDVAGVLQDHATYLSLREDFRKKAEAFGITEEAPPAPQ